MEIKKINSPLIFLILLASMVTMGQEKERWHNISREIHYLPEGNSFVLKSGTRKFNRALYGTNSGFRVEAGDLPEFALYMPGMGGNFKLGFAKGANSKWITEAKTIDTRYTLGIMHYKIEDPLLGDGALHIEIVAVKKGEGFALKVMGHNIPKDITLLWAFGGASGKKFSRDGDIGADPESVFYLQPAYCINNSYKLKKESFLLRYGSESNKEKKGNNRSLIGIHPVSKTHLADATKQQTPISLYNSTGDSLVVITGKIDRIPKKGLFWMLENNTSTKYGSQQALAAVFRESVEETQQLANRVRVVTPDPFINTLGGALSIAADAIWESPAYLHGAVAWRMHLNAWRGAYVADPLGWHDRAKTHFTSYGNSQVTAPLTGPVVFDTVRNLARQKEEMGTAMFSSGYISRNPNKNTVAHHYDMNLVFIDQLLRHFKWTGDTSFMKEMWPVIQRHLDWEKRNFDCDADGLYDAYASIWASDALQYSGGGVIHSSAYTYYANKTAATIAKMLHQDSLRYEKEAQNIFKSANEQLWIPEKGIFAEYKDLLGNRLLHINPGIWSIYHAIDEEISNPFQRYQMLRYVETKIPHIPILAQGLDKKDLYTISTTNWQPYTWSINNVALAEQLHTSLAFWQGGQSEVAFTMWESAIIESMYLGASPGGFEQLLFHDAIRGELYRDFADPIGMVGRTLVEGLFGIQPDALADTVTIQPGLPAKWDHATLDIPDISFSFNRENNTDSYHIKPRFEKKMGLKFVVNVPYENIKNVFINGEKAAWKIPSDGIGLPKLILESPFREQYDIEITWEGKQLEQPEFKKTYDNGDLIALQTAAKIIAVYDPQAALSGMVQTDTQWKGNVKGSEDKTFFVKLQQGNQIWWSPINSSIQPKIVGNPIQFNNDQLIFSLKNNSSNSIRGNLILRPYGTEMAQKVVLNENEDTRIAIPVENLVPGTNTAALRTANGETHQMAFTNWDIPIKKEQQFEFVPLSGVFNAKVTDIFNASYAAPRPQSPTLQLPTQGVGNWCYPNIAVTIDDSGLREKAKTRQQIITPQGIALQTPSDSTQKNIAFTSLWDNFPESIEIPLHGHAAHLYVMVAGSTNPMQSRFVNGKIEVSYTDGSTEVLLLKNPENWWPIEQDFFSDGFAFSTNAPKPPRVYLKSGIITRSFDDFKAIKGFSNFGIDGGAATILDLPLDRSKTLKALTIKTIANDVVIGLMSATLIR